MARPSKPAAVIIAEGKSHRTKAELATREAAEKALLTGEKMKETDAVKRDKFAHIEFERVSALLALIGKDDDLYSAPINRYCLIASEAEFYRREIAKLRRSIETDTTLTAKDKLALLKQAASFDTTLAAKRRALLEIEKETCMTLAAALRVIPKDANALPEVDPLKELLSGRNINIDDGEDSEDFVEDSEPNKETIETLEEDVDIDEEDFEVYADGSV